MSNESDLIHSLYWQHISRDWMVLMTEELASFCSFNRGSDPVYISSFRKGANLLVGLTGAIQES